MRVTWAILEQHNLPTHLVNKQSRPTALELCDRGVALVHICTGPCTNLILDPGSSSLCYMVAGPLGGAVGGSTRKWIHQRLGALTVLGKTNQDGEVHWIPVPDPENPFDSWRGCSESPCVSSVQSSAQQTAPHTCRGQKQHAGLAHTSDCPTERCSEMLRRAGECVALHIQ